jgi:hypothetical protein
MLTFRGVTGWSNAKRYARPAARFVPPDVPDAAQELPEDVLWQPLLMRPGAGTGVDLAIRRRRRVATQGVAAGQRGSFWQRRALYTR